MNRKSLVTLLAVPLVGFGSAAQAERVIFEEDFEYLRSFNGEMLHDADTAWSVARPGSNTPLVNVTVTYGVAAGGGRAAGGVSGGGFVQRQIGNFELTEESILQVDMVSALSSRQPGGTSNTTLFNTAVGVGPFHQEFDTVDTAPLHFGSSHDAFYLRLPGWGQFANARDGSGANLFAIGLEIYTCRMTLDLTTGLATYQIRSETREETEFTQLFFNAEQTIDTIQVTDIENFVDWDTVWMRVGASGGARILNVRISDLSGAAELTEWAGYPVDENGWIHTGDLMGSLYVAQAPVGDWGWVWSMDLSNWFWVNEADIGGSMQPGFWSFIVAPPIEN